MPKPPTAADLDQFYGAANWICAGIPEFAALTAPIQAFLTKHKWPYGNREPQLAKVILSPDLWTPDLQNSFDEIKTFIASRVKLTNVDLKKRLCLHTDASDLYYAAVLTQLPVEDIDKPQAEQRHAALSFVSGAFKGAMLKWSTFEKEAFAIIHIQWRDYIILQHAQ